MFDRDLRGKKNEEEQFRSECGKGEMIALAIDGTAAWNVRCSSHSFTCAYASSTIKKHQIQNEMNLFLFCHFTEFITKK